MILFICMVNKINVDIDKINIGIDFIHCSWYISW